MNDLTREILTKILPDPKLWDPKTRAPKVKDIRAKYLDAREYLWVQKVYFPRYCRATRLLKAMGVMPEDHFEWIEQDFSEGWVIVCDICGDEVQYRLDRYFQSLWEAPGWEYEELTKSEILAMNIKPTPEPSKQTKTLLDQGQLMLFGA